MGNIGISGMAAAVPALRVDLQNWCQWRDNQWEKVRQVVGSSYRTLAPNQNVYTLAATAAARLISNYDIDPERIGYLALGTESSTDNSAGAIIVKGMLDMWASKWGLPQISRHCETPELKHACLGGMYALKGALRYLATDGHDRLALVISSDVAEYAPGSSGEQTQGAGAVAMLIDSKADLATADILLTGNASSYRGADFRKPFSRFLGQTPNPNHHISDFPLFNGKYSTYCYVDEILAAMDDMFAKRGLSGAQYFRDLPVAFLHRPYHRLPRTAWGIAYLFALGKGNARDMEELRSYCTVAGVDLQALLSEMSAKPNLFEMTQLGLAPDPYPLTTLVLQALRESDAFQEVVVDALRLGSDTMLELGNLYTASLPAWMAAAFEQSLEEKRNPAGEEWLAIGYGSGDAAEVMPMWISENWHSAAGKIGLAEAMANPIDLDLEQYEALRDGANALGLSMPANRPGEFIIAGRGKHKNGPLVDEGLEYYDLAD